MLTFREYHRLMVAEFKGADLSPTDYEHMKEFRVTFPDLHLCSICANKQNCSLPVPTAKVVSCRRFREN